MVIRWCYTDYSLEIIAESDNSCHMYVCLYDVCMYVYIYIYIYECYHLHLIRIETEFYQIFFAGKSTLSTTVPQRDKRNCTRILSIKNAPNTERGILMTFFAFFSCMSAELTDSHKVPSMKTKYSPKHLFSGDILHIFLHMTLKFNWWPSSSRCHKYLCIH